MRFRFFDGIRRLMPLAFVAAAILAPVVVAGTAVSAATPSGLAYDEITRMVMSSPLPVPGSFKSDFQAAMDAATAVANAPKHHGLFAAAMDAAEKAKAMYAAIKVGSPSSRYYMNDWERTDSFMDQTATIIRPDRKQIIHLNLAAKTYTIEDMGAKVPVTSETPPPYQNPGGPTESPQPGTGKLDITSTSALLGPKTIDGIQTTGYTEDLKIVASQSTGSCKDGTFETSITEYISSITPPLAKTNPALKYALAGHPMSLNGAHAGCNQTTTTHRSGSISPPSDHLNIWTLTTFKASGQTDSGQMGGNLSMLIERGNVRDLGPADAALFDIPAGFTKAQ